MIVRRARKNTLVDTFEEARKIEKISDKLERQFEIKR